ncbi:fibronectin type III domain-containing protein [Mesonia sp. MT50]|uniref:Fibronectin type III domain-containing protein n=1 Tax=Mesonia profundi TaxID=3070998 RepID=A0ABU0ZY83_9FLAO|nr:fibronectin type III domain-containing protein [Mesonia profundi]MDQ7916425.1 fibronectin type III domain-containing protein [Mesonia profundi]
MKKITLLICLFLTSYLGWSQVYVEEDFSDGSLPSGWVNNDIEGSGDVWQFDNPAGRTIVAPMSEPIAILDSDNYGSGNNQNAALETNVFDASAATAVQLSFDHYFKDATFTNGEAFVEVYDGTSWVEVAMYNSDTSNPASVIIDISNEVEGITNAQVRFRYVGSFDYYWLVDNIYVGAPPSCPKPTDILADNTNSDSADVSWTAGNAETEWEVLYGETGFDTATEGTSVSVTGGTAATTLTGLTSATPYEVYVKAICAVNDESDYAGPLSFTSLATPPANDECDDAISLTVNQDLDCAVVTSGTTVSATASSQEDDVVGTPDNDVWFSFEAEDTQHRIELSNITAVLGTSLDMAMAVYDGTAGCEALVLVDDSDPNSFNVSGLTIGSTYYLRVYGWGSTNSAQATFDVCVGTLPPPPANDACEDAIEIAAFPYTNSQDASTATNNDGFIAVTDCGSANDGVWYTIVGDGGDITVQVTETSSWDSEIGVFTGSCGSFTCVDNVDTTNDVEELTFTSEAGTNYYVNIANWSGSTDNAEGAFDLLVTSTGGGGSTTEDCGQEQFSNAFENGLFMEEGGQLLANDFIVSANTLNFSVDNITANILSQGGIDSMDIIFYEDNDGVPGTEIQTFEDVVPTSQDIIGDAFGFDAHEVVLDLPTPVDFAGDGVNAVTYWVQLVGVPTTAGTQLGWETTTLNQIGNPYVFDNENTTEWTAGDADGVFSITGQCEYIEGCLQPEALTASNITIDSVDLMWTEVGDATEWTIEYGASGFTLGDGTVEVDSDGTPGITITGLDSLTEYDFYVTANCTGGDSNPLGPLTVSTVDTYCQPIIDFSVEPITLVEIANISNVSDAAVDGSPAVENFTDQIVEVEQSDSYAIALEGNTGGGFDNFFTVFVDWNQNGLLDDASEVYEIGSITGSTGTDGQQATGTIAVPADAMIGETRMRVYKNYNSSVTDPCASNSYGQIEDYMVNVSEGTVNPCAAPSDIVVDPITDATADVSWTENGTAVEWEIEYGEPGFAPGTGTVVQDNDGTLGETLENLSPETTYDVYVRAICADGTQSDWTAVETFTTDEFSVNNSNFQNFSYYPNPVKANLSLKAGLEIEKVSVYNLLGQEVIVLNPNSLNAKIDLSRLQAGPYMLRVSINGDIKTFKVIKN